MTTTGVLGGQWRATVTAWGAIEPWDGTPVLDWHIAADDRWHSPQHEPAVRQATADGAPVVETRVRIPNGDAVQRVFSVADAGGLTVIEVENESPLPIAVAFNRRDVRSARPPSAAPIRGISLPPDAVLFPVSHRATLTVALAHDGSGAGALPVGLPSAQQVASGWVAMSDRASRFVLPDLASVESLVAARCELALAGPAHPDDDPVGFLIGVGQLVRMGERADDWVPDVAHAVEQAVKRAEDDWALPDAFVAAEVVFASAGEDRARRDLATMLRRRGSEVEVLPSLAPEGVRLAAWLERHLVDRHGRLLPAGIPLAWLGANIEAYHLPVGADARLSLAIRWHGERPAVLWEVEGDTAEGGGITFTAPIVAPLWSTVEPKGEALWPSPATAAVRIAVAEGESFS